MTVTTDALVPALEDAREAHAAVIDRFRTDISVTPAGPHRQKLERHIADARDNIARIDDHLRAIHPRRPLQNATEVVRFVSSGVIRAASLPLVIGALGAGSIWRGRRQATEHQLLKNAENEYTAAARALASCRAGESIANIAHDKEATDLLAKLRRQDEQLLQTLEHSLDEQAQALASATANGGRSAQPNGGLAGAASHAVRAAADRIREAARTGGQQATRAAAGAAREMPRSAAWMAGQAQGAATREEDLPISHYDRLTVNDLTRQLRKLPQSDLAIIEGYERAHANRTSVVKAIEDLRNDHS
jgi:hypothetical protein